MTIAQQLKIKDFPFIIKDKDGNVAEAFEAMTKEVEP